MFKIYRIYIQKKQEGTKNTYLLIQLSHTLLNLLNYGDVLIKILETTKKVSDLIHKALTSIIQSLNINRQIQLSLT